MRQVMAIVLREMIIFKRKFFRYFFSFTVSPLLYLIAFGWAGKDRLGPEDSPYSLFMLPGLVAMSSMVNSFALASEINISRFYWKTFDEIRSSPIRDWAYVAGEVIAGVIRGSLAALLVVLLGLVFGVWLSFGLWLALAVLLNTFVFASLAVSVAMLAKGHADQAMISSFVITPMAFLCGTFFPVAYYPAWVQWLVKLLPLTQASTAIRASALGQPLPWISFAYLVALGGVCLLLAIWVVRRSKN